MATTLYLTSSATASPFPTTSRLLSTTNNASEVSLGPGEFDSGLPGTTDSGQWNPNSALGDTTASAEIDNTGASPGTGRQGWLWDQSLTGRKLPSGVWSVQLRLRANQGTGTLGRILARVSIVHGSSGTYVTDQNILTTAITGEASHSSGQNGWRANEGSRVTVTSTAANFSVTIESGATAGSRTFAAGERILVELGFGDADSTADRTWRLDYNTANSFVTIPDLVDPITGTANGLATVSGALTAKGALSGTSAGEATVAGSLTAKGALSGTAAGTSTASGDLTEVVQSGAIAGTAAGAATVSGALTGKGALVGTAAGAAAVSGALTADGALSGTSAGAAVVSGALTAKGALSGTSAGVATVSGAIREQTATGELAGTSAGTSTVTGTLLGKGALSGTSTGLATVSATLVAKGALAGTSTGTATVTGALVAKGALSGSVAGVATVTGALSEQDAQDPILSYTDGTLRTGGSARGKLIGGGTTTGILRTGGTTTGMRA